jgi:hypothetical protein
MEVEIIKASHRFNRLNFRLKLKNALTNDDSS